MPQQVRHLHQKSISFSANTKESIDLTKGSIYREIYLRLKGQPTITALNNTAANTKRGDEWAVVKRVRLIANNSNVIWDVSGNYLWWVNFFLFGARSKVTTTLGDGATADPQFDSTLIIPIWMPQILRSFDTVLDARRVSSLVLEVEWGTYTDINANATGWTTEPSVDVAALTSFVTGQFDFEPTLFRMYQIELDVNATNPNFQHLFTVGPMYRGFIINTTDAGVDVGSVLNNIKIKSGSNVYYDMKAQAVQDLVAQRRNLTRSFDGQNYDDLRIGNGNSFDGFYFVDFVTDGLLTEAPDTANLAEFGIEMDVTKGAGATKITILPLELTPPRGKKAA